MTVKIEQSAMPPSDQPNVVLRSREAEGPNEACSGVLPTGPVWRPEEVKALLAAFRKINQVFEEVGDGSGISKKGRQLIVARHVLAAALALKKTISHLDLKDHVSSIASTTVSLIEEEATCSSGESN